MSVALSRAIEIITYSVNSADSDVFIERQIVSKIILKDNPYHLTQRLQVIIAKVAAVEQDATFRWIVETCQQLYERRFTGSVFADER